MLAEFVYEMGSWEVDTDRRELRAHGRAVPIGSRAFEIIEQLVRRAGQFVSKDELVQHVWQGATVEENTLRVHIHAIRKALGPDRTLLKTDSGRGYRLIGRWTAKRDGGQRPQSARLLSAQERLHSNLPASTSPLIGRGPELQQLRALVSAFRVVTLTGAGGIGKTTLALELARSVLTDFDDGVCQVELASLADPGLVPSVVAAALGGSATGAMASADGLARTIGMAKLLLVLDNCEHLADAAARLIEAIVQQCPNVTLLVTSREVMRVDGERVFRVPPLDVPAARADRLDLVLKSSAVELFVARMQALDNRFVPDPTTVLEVANVCRHLDGIPLAIEFAAARAVTLGIQQVAASLGNRLDLLTSRRRSVLPRHRTLRATLDWSYTLLSEAERDVLMKLAIFAGTFTLDDAQAVTNAPDTVEHLSELVDKSLVVAASTSTATFYWLLETTRAYALEKLESAGETEAAARRHAGYYLSMFERIQSEWQTRPTSELHDAYAWRHDNLRAALDWSFSDQGDAALGVALTAAAVPFWMQISSLVEWRQRMEQALAHLPDGGSGDARRDMKIHAALGAALVGFQRAEKPWEKVLSLARDLGDLEHQLLSLYGLWVARRTGSLELARQFETIASTTADQLVADAMFGFSHHMLGNQNEARRRLDRVAAKRSALGASATIIRFRGNQALVADAYRIRVLWLQGHSAQAVQAASEVVERAIAASHVVSICHVLAFGACRVSLWAEDIEKSQHYTSLSADYSSRHELGIFRDWNRCHLGTLDILRGYASEGITKITDALDTFRSAGRGFWMLDTSVELASALGRVGQIDEGLSVIMSAEETAERTDEKWILPEVLRVRGELLRQKAGGVPSSDSDTCFDKALEMAGQQGALFWQLRAATSLAESLRHQTRCTEAAAVLRPIYDRFTEGLDLPFLRSAKSLLESVAD